MTVTERNELFQRGLEFERKDQPNLALQCYLGCINGLKNKSFFVLLPQCLHNVSLLFWLIKVRIIFVSIFNKIHNILGLKYLRTVTVNTAKIEDENINHVWKRKGRIC